MTYRHPGVNRRLLSIDERARAIELCRSKLGEGKKHKAGGKYEALTLEQIAFGQKVVFENATALIRDAKWLRLKRSYARAFALAKLAQEELGKISLLDSVVLLAFVGAKESEWAPFWRLWRDHKGKSFFVKLPFSPEVMTPERINYEEEAKLAALYVEIKDGSFSVPDQSISRAMVDEMLDICDVGVIHIKAKFRDVPLLNRDGSSGPGIEGLLTAFWEMAQVE
jgi:AbiV family abortive infection protein